MQMSLDSDAPPHETPKAPSPLRRDYRAIQKLYDDRRTPDRLIAHYGVEIALADKLRRSTRESRNRAYQEVYSELLARVPDHPRRTRKQDSARRDIAKTSRTLRHFIKRNDHILEIGAGDGALSHQLCDRAASVVAVDIDDALAPDAANDKPNFLYLLSDGIVLPLSGCSITFAFSNQVLEHIHPDDTLAHLQEVHRVLQPCGRYFVLTPNLVAGPHDVSRYFDRRARGTHLREFDAKSIRACLRAAGFRRIVFYAARGGHVFFAMPYWIARSFDLLFGLTPRALHTAIVRNKGARALLGLAVMAYKGAA